MNRHGSPAALIAAFMCVGVLAGCAAPAPTASAPPAAPVAAVPAAAPAPEPQCNAASAQFAIGQNSTPQLEAAAAYRAGAGVARSLRRGQAATAEVDAGRLTMEVDAKGKVTAVRCG